MNSNAIPAANFDRADEQFFRLVQPIFSPEFVFGAGVLLGSYDEEEPPYVPAEQVPVAHASPVRV